MAPRRVLIVVSEPPPMSSGLGTLLAKVAMGASDETLAIDFLGPDPVRCSSHGESGLPFAGRLHALGEPPLARRASVRRAASSGLARQAWGLVRGPFALFERWTERSLYEEWMARRTEDRLARVLADGRYDLVAAKAPPLPLAEVSRRVAQAAGVPFAYMMGDPVDHRDETGELRPRGRERQQDLIDTSSAFLTRQSSYERHYARLFRPDPSRVVFFEDSFVPVGHLPELEPRVRLESTALLHWGQVDPWRPLDTLVEALAHLHESRRAAGLPRYRLTVMGAVIGASAVRLARWRLGAAFEQIPAMPLLDARAVARTARSFVVLVSHRHRDNIPSKLLDALAFGKPILLLAHPDSSSAALVSRLGIGPVADIRDIDSILGALADLEGRREDYERAYGNPAVEEWRYDNVGRRFREGLFRALRW